MSFILQVTYDDDLYIKIIEGKIIFITYLKSDYKINIGADELLKLVRLDKFLDIPIEYLNNVQKMIKEDLLAESFRDNYTLLLTQMKPHNIENIIKA